MDILISDEEKNFLNFMKSFCKVYNEKLDERTIRDTAHVRDIVDNIRSLADKMETRIRA